MTLYKYIPRFHDILFRYFVNIFTAIRNYFEHCVISKVKYIITQPNENIVKQNMNFKRNMEHGNM